MKSYVYCITNLVNQKRYVGKTINPNSRWKSHRKGIRTQQKLKPLPNSIRKHGKENFVYKILCVLQSEEEAYELEKKLIAKWNLVDREFGYNLHEGGRGGTNPSPETRAKQSASARKRKASPETKALLSSLRKAEWVENHDKRIQERLSRKHKHSDETRQKIGDSQRGDLANHSFLGKCHSEETKLRMSESHKRVWANKRDQ